MVPFAGYDMPVQYPDGIIKEHLHCREHAGIFDVSHMGQVKITGKDAKSFLERATVADIEALGKGKATLSLLMNEKGGIKDDCIITKDEEEKFFVVLNAGCKEKDLKHLNALKDGEFAKKDLKIEYSESNSLIAIQGPKAAALLEKLVGQSLSHMDFMTSALMSYSGSTIRVSRCGYTGEDGFEVSVPGEKVVQFVEALQSHKTPDGIQIGKFVGLGARDTLRLEAGLCLYGHELEENISPIEATLAWTISKRRKETGGYLGDKVVKKHMEEGVSRKRVGFVVEGPPAREHVKITKDGKEVGEISSGTHGPSLKKSIGMAYINLPHNKLGTKLEVSLRNKTYPLIVTKMPFVPSRYYKKQ
eukprot:CAMPEP_0202965114 /NCGR_PEP_ID=MMETSP1396-20130829/9204_1 /ASSEMBLY_ACC=CAM_ASM_000872 /TAXON_ID= /ORGANISM="Pseudokeronopsis sp., Strain Brazil" /LENGTH=359 /DNA_ID=CAMNT_0049687737 /DNA_START=135 /DNA_END=1214 /DNA_ORIENTATION=-